MSAEPARHGPDRRLLIALAVAVTILLALSLLSILGGDEEPVEQADPSPTGSRETPTDVAAEQPTESSAPTPAPTEEESPTEPTPVAQPGEDSVAAFAETHGPADHTVTGDVTGDGVDEVVLARVRDDTTQIIVGRWDGAVYRRILRDQGGSAEAVERCEIRDYNGVPGGEIVTEQTVGGQGRSISVWGRAAGQVERQTAQGGCWDGFHTYGVNGVSIDRGRISATCDASAFPGDVQTRDVYRWSSGRWRYARTVSNGV
ncbi:MAG: hypothetical protein GEU74_00685 [Nitriliruptorales bacterium]|nr:hypothetical protein [Nitriliruptorales bacterium]